MFIQTEATPNPATLKFLPGKVVMETGTAEFRSADEAEASPLATRLFEIPGVTGVYFGYDFISVSKEEQEWQHLKPAILGSIMEHFMSGKPVMGSTSVLSEVQDAGGEFFDEGDEAIVLTIKELLDKKEGVKTVKTTAKSTAGDTSILGDSDVMQDIFHKVNKIAPTDANILLLGENGTGKDLMAKAIHERSLRADKPFIKVDVGALTDT